MGARAGAENCSWESMQIFTPESLIVKSSKLLDGFSQAEPQAATSPRGILGPLQILWEQPVVANLLAALWFRGSVFTSMGFSPDHPWVIKGGAFIGQGCGAKSLPSSPPSRSAMKKWSGKTKVIVGVLLHGCACLMRSLAHRSFLPAGPWGELATQGGPLPIAAGDEFECRGHPEDFAGSTAFLRLCR